MLRSMPITSVRVAGFKAFDEEQTLELTDCNLVYGANSAGKSTFFQALLLLRQSLDTAYGAGRGVLNFRSPENDLGGFGTAVHHHELDKRFRIGVTLADVFLEPFFSGPLAIDFTFGHNAEDSQTELTSVIIKDTNGRISFGRDDALRLSDAASATSIVERWLRVLEMGRTGRRQSNRMEPSPSDITRLKKWLRSHDTDLTGWLPIWPPSSFGAGRPGRPFGGSLNSPQHAMLTNLVAYWENATYSLSSELFRALSSIVYSGPLREFPKRVATEAGAGTLIGSRGERLALYLANNQHLLPRINAALKSLGIQYSLTIRKLETQEVTDALGEVAILLLHDARSSLTVTPADVGFGVSQVLPVITHLLTWQDRMILIEQPEIHLHPKLQGRLADLIRTSIQENGNTVVVETHSEHILFRLQRHIRTGDMRHDAVSVNYVSPEGKSSQVRRLELGEQGDLLDPWPGDFFEEKLQDLFAGR